MSRSHWLSFCSKCLQKKKKWGGGERQREKRWLSAQEELALLWAECPLPRTVPHTRLGSGGVRSSLRAASMAPAGSRPNRLPLRVNQGCLRNRCWELLIWPQKISKSEEEEEDVEEEEVLGGSGLRQLWALIRFCEIAAELCFFFFYVKEGRTHQQRRMSTAGAPLRSSQQRGLLSAPLSKLQTGR